MSSPSDSIPEKSMSPRPVVLRSRKTSFSGRCGDMGGRWRGVTGRRAPGKSGRGSVEGGHDVDHGDGGFGGFAPAVQFVAKRAGFGLGGVFDEEDFVNHRDQMRNSRI